VTGPLYHYAVYGDVLASVLPFPELDEIPVAPPRWTVNVVSELPTMVDATELGAEPLYADVFARLFTHAGGHRIVVDDTGAFDISPDRCVVTCAPRDGAWPDFVRAHLTGRVFATMLYLDELLPLHSSAVETRDGVVAFLAPKGYGKSTLALALTKAGAHLVSDDTLPVEPAEGRAWPGVHGLRVRDDSLAAVGVARPGLVTREGKLVVTALGTERAFARPAPLAAIYLLAPVEPDGVGVEREPVPNLVAAIGIVAHVKIGRMLGPTAAAPMLDRAAAIAGRVQVFRLYAPRDLAQLPDVAATILGWHGVPA
jgi:hypothetical protein